MYWPGAGPVLKRGSTNRNEGYGQTYTHPLDTRVCSVVFVTVVGCVSFRYVFYMCILTTTRVPVFHSVCHIYFSYNALKKETTNKEFFHPSITKFNDKVCVHTNHDKSS